MGIDGLMKGQKIFKECAYLFEEFGLSEPLIAAAAQEEFEPEKSAAKRVAIAAFGIGFVLGLGMSTDDLHRELDKVSGNEKGFALLLHVSSLKKKMQAVGLLKPDFS